jgi:hypothetical protein
MMLALCSGMTLDQFWRSTIGEILLVISAANERRKQDAAMQVCCILRALGAAFGNSGTDPLDGLIDKPESVPISLDEARRLRFWRPPS